MDRDNDSVQQPYTGASSFYILKGLQEKQRKNVHQAGARGLRQLSSPDAHYSVTVPYRQETERKRSHDGGCGGTRN